MIEKCGFFFILSLFIPKYIKIDEKTPFKGGGTKI